MGANSDTEILTAVFVVLYQFRPRLTVRKEATENWHVSLASLPTQHYVIFQLISRKEKHLRQVTSLQHGSLISTRGLCFYFLSMKHAFIKACSWHVM